MNKLIKLASDIMEVTGSGTSESNIISTIENSDYVKELWERYNEAVEALNKISKYGVSPTSETELQRIKRLKSIADKSLFIIKKHEG